VLFIILYPVNGNKAGLLAASFFFRIINGYVLEFGWSSRCCLFSASVLQTPPFFRFSFGLSYEYQTVRLNDSLTPERFSFLLIAVHTASFCPFYTRSI